MQILNKHKSGEPEGSFYIGRGSVYGNPFVMGIHGDRETVVKRFRTYLAKQLLEPNSDLLKAILELKDTDQLVCYCAPASCHGDVIKEFWKLLKEKGLESIQRMVNEVPQSVSERLANPLQDGVTHINVYSGATTKIGRWLSNFTHAPFEHPEHGSFESVEGYWYWLSTGMKHDDLRKLFGFDAKSFGRKLKVTPHKHFRSLICQAILSKVRANPIAANKIAETTLPFTHYYFFGSPVTAKLGFSNSGDWQMEFLERVRRHLQGKATKTMIAGSRSITDFNLVERAYQQSNYEAVEIISGTARGVDQLGEDLAEKIPVAIRRFPADWDGPDGLRAGFVRNSVMVAYCDNGVLLHDGISKGTPDTKKKLEEANKPFYFVQHLS